MTRRKTKAQINGEHVTYWRSIETRKRTEEYINYLEDEFAPDISELTAMDRRSMLKFMGASVALAGIGVSCRRPEEKILPYVKQPENYVAGAATYFATAQPTPFGLNPILVESHEGRPTKVEGNPSHHESNGKASYLNQASVLELYDPDRSRFPVFEQAGIRMPVEWAEWDSFQKEHFKDVKEAKGQGLAIVTDSDIGPTFLRLKNLLKATYPKAQFYVHEPMLHRNEQKGTELAFGENTRVRYHLKEAKRIVSLFADPLAFGPNHLLHLQGFSKKRGGQSAADAPNLNRLYAVEANLSLTGTNADNRLRIPVGLAKLFVLGLAYELHANNGVDIDLKQFKEAKSFSEIVARPPSIKAIDKKFVVELAKDLASHKGESLIIAGDHLAPEVLAMVHAINIALQGHGKVFDVLLIDDKDAAAHLKEPNINQFYDDIGRSQINTVMFLGTNPVYSSPGQKNFKEALARAKVSIHLGLHQDETGSLCTWHLPETHFLEHFADGRSFDGTISVVQPLIKPLHNSRSKLQIMAEIIGLKESKPKELVYQTFKEKLGDLYEKPLKKIIHDGFWQNSAFKTMTPQLKGNIYEPFLNVLQKNPDQKNIELIIDWDRSVLDGRFANHAWLQELADPVHKLAWDNALFMSPVLAKALKIKSGVIKNAYMADIVEIELSGKVKKKLPVFVLPGLSDYCVITHFGYGRTAAGKIGNNIGTNVYDLVRDFSERVFQNVKIAKTNDQFRLTSMQEQFAMNAETVQSVDVLTLQGRNPARVATAKEYQNDPHYAQKGLPENLLVEGKHNKVPLQITDPWPYDKGNQWGMVADLSKCTGCNSCVTACQSENNIPVVGREQSQRGRNMLWIRLDRYFEGSVKDPLAVVQPVFCQHCENAPCEPVCPVAATVHDKEGLNAMVYNRCVGTRYCANNCPFKVRRFNYFDYTHSGDAHVAKEDRARSETLKLQRNPEVTVRYRGVMEKCSYCVQRIQEAKSIARNEKRDPNNLRDGDVTPACVQTCPSDALIFGNINDPKSKVAQAKAMDRNYTMLDILNLRPRTSYLSKVRNPNPSLEI